MGFRDGAFCKLWKLDTTGKYPQGQISISRKDKDSGDYVDDFSGYVSFIGDAATAIKKIPAQGRFKIKGCDVSRVWNKEKQREFINFRVFDLEDATSATQNAAPANQQKSRGTAKKQSDDMSVAELEARLAEAKLRESGRSVAENPDDLPF